MTGETEMNAIAETKVQLQVRHEALRIGGEKIFRDEVIEVRNPYDGTLVGTVPKATLEDVRHAFELSLDREALSQVVYAGMYQPNAQATSAISPCCFGCQPSSSRVRWLEAGMSVAGAAWLR